MSEHMQRLKEKGDEIMSVQTREVTKEQQEIMELERVLARKEIVIEELLKIITKMTNVTWRGLTR